MGRTDGAGRVRERVREQEMDGVREREVQGTPGTPYERGLYTRAHTHTQPNEQGRLFDHRGDPGAGRARALIRDCAVTAP